MIHPRSSTWESLLGARFGSTRCADGLRCLGSEKWAPIVPITTNSLMESGEDPTGSAKLPRLKLCLNRTGVRPASSIARRMAHRLRPDSGHVLGFGKMSVGAGIAGTAFAGRSSERHQLRSRSAGQHRTSAAPSQVDSPRWKTRFAATGAWFADVRRNNSPAGLSLNVAAHGRFGLRHDPGTCRGHHGRLERARRGDRRAGIGYTAPQRSGQACSVQVRLSGRLDAKRYCLALIGSRAG